MFNDYHIYIDDEENILEIIKNPSKKVVKKVQGKYGVSIGQDINGHTVGISIPDFDVLFGIKKKDIESFLMYFP